LAERIDIRRAAMRSGFLLRREWFVFEKIWIDSFDFRWIKIPRVDVFAE
jgi:hypothetical protein